MPRAGEHECERNKCSSGEPHSCRGMQNSTDEPENFIDFLPEKCEPPDFAKFAMRLDAINDRTCVGGISPCGREYLMYSVYEWNILWH